MHLTFICRTALALPNSIVLTYIIERKGLLTFEPKDRMKDF